MDMKNSLESLISILEVLPVNFIKHLVALLANKNNDQRGLLSCGFFHFFMYFFWYVITFSHCPASFRGFLFLLLEPPPYFVAVVASLSALISHPWHTQLSKNHR